MVKACVAHEHVTCVHLRSKPLHGFPQLLEPLVHELDRHLHVALQVVGDVRHDALYGVHDRLLEELSGRGDRGAAEAHALRALGLEALLLDRASRRGRLRDLGGEPI